jgi:Tfp pilus assembly protein PilV
MRKQVQKLVRRILSGHSRGIGFVEVVIAMSIATVVSLSLFYALSNTVLATRRVEEKTMVTSIARSQMEYVKSQRYSDSYQELNAGELPDDWSASDDVSISLQDVDPSYLQLVTVTVSYRNSSYELQGYRTNR